MATTLEEYRQAKTNYLKLKNQAKRELMARFNELAGELLQIQRELLEDFGEKVTMPVKPKKGKPAPKKGETAAAPAPPPQEKKPAAPSPKAVAIQRQLEKHKQKLADAKAAGKPTRAIEDRIYELEDELRLLQAE